MNGFEDKSPEKWNVQMCWRQIQQQTAPLISQSGYCNSERHYNAIVVENRQWNGGDPETAPSTQSSSFRVWY